MSWTRALIYAGLGMLLGGVYFVTAPPPPPSRATAPETARPGASVDSMVLESGTRTVRANRVGEQWRVVEPPGNTVPSDLISALVSAVLETPAEPVSPDAEQLADFGLDNPSARLTFGRSNAAPVTLVLGGRNPAATGVYGKLEGHPQVILVGLNVRYYIDLVLRQSGDA